MGVGSIVGSTPTDNSIGNKLTQASQSSGNLNASLWDLEKEENDGDGAHFKLLNIADRYLRLDPDERRHLRDHWFGNDAKDGAYWPGQQVRDKMRRAMREAVREARAKRLPIKTEWKEDTSLPANTFPPPVVDSTTSKTEIILRITTSPPRQPGP